MTVHDLHDAEDVWVESPGMLGYAIDCELDQPCEGSAWRVVTNLVWNFGIDGIRQGLAELHFYEEPHSKIYVTWQEIHDRQKRDAERLEIINMLVELNGAIHHGQHHDSTS